MKNLTLIVLSFFCIQALQAQVLIKRDTLYPEKDATEETGKKQVKKESKPKMETLFQNQKSIGAYLGISMGYTTVENQDAVIAGTRIMVIANNYLGIGFGGKGFISNPSTLYYEDASYSVSYIDHAGGYGGLYLEPIILGLKPVHVSAPILVGAGAVVCDQRFSDHTLDYNLTSVFFTVEPGLDIELNIARWFRISLGASYRFTSKIDDIDNKPTDFLNGFNYGMTFKLGWF